jgi:hypothetical protein
LCIFDTYKISYYLTAINIGKLSSKIENWQIS